MHQGRLTENDFPGPGVYHYITYHVYIIKDIRRKEPIDTRLERLKQNNLEPLTLL